MRCKTCHYSLTGLAEHRCPECGTPFDPNDPTTFEHRRLVHPGEIPTTHLVALLLVSCGVPFILSMLSHPTAPLRPPSLFDAVLGSLIVGPIIFAILYIGYGAMFAVFAVTTHVIKRWR